MKNIFKTLSFAALATVGALVSSNCATKDPATRANASHSSRRQIAADSHAALHNLYAKNPQARRLGAKAKGVLVFPSILKGGFLVGGMGGNGALIMRDGTVREYYETTGVSYGFQAGIQEYGYALLLMDDQAFNFVSQADGWEVGTSPGLVIVDQGAAASLSSNTAHKGIYAFIFNQRGLMGGIGLQGSKITRIHPRR